MHKKKDKNNEKKKEKRGKKKNQIKAYIHIRPPDFYRAPTLTKHAPDCVLNRRDSTGEAGSQDERWDY